MNAIDLHKQEALKVSCLIHDIDYSWAKEEQDRYDKIKKLLSVIPEDGVCNIAYEYDFRKYETYSMVGYNEAFRILSDIKYLEECIIDLVPKEAVVAEINRLNKLLA